MIRRALERCRPLYSRPELRVVLVLNVLLGLAYSFVTPFFSMFGTLEVKMSTWLFGVFMTTTTLAGIFFGTVLAHYSDTRYSRRTMLLLGGVSGMFGYIGYAFLRDFTSLVLVGSLVLGISTICFSQTMAMAREHLKAARLPTSETAFYMNIFRMFFALSWTVGPAAGSWIMVAYSFRGLFLCAAAGFLVFLTVVWRYVPATELNANAAKSPPSQSLSKLLARADVLAHFSAIALIFTATTIGMMNLPLLVLKDLGGTERHVGIIYSVAPMFELPLMFYFGVLATRIDTAKIMRLGMLIGVLYYLLLVLVRAPWHVYPLQFLSAALVAVVSGVAITYFQDYLPHHPGTATNLYVTAQRIGSTAGYLLFGTLAWHYGYRNVFVFCTGLAGCALLLMFVPSRRDEPDALPQAVVSG